MLHEMCRSSLAIALCLHSDKEEEAGSHSKDGKLLLYTINTAACAKQLQAPLSKTGLFKHIQLPSSTST
jgi:hypothetical protein